MSNTNNAVVETRAGKLEGLYQDDVYMFKGIPFAAPPVGELRWLPPQPVEPWKGVRPAQKYSNACPQRVSIANLPAFIMDDPQSEDCLSLNIWTPGLDNAKRPVFVWVHGGAFNMGSGSQLVYTGTKFAKRCDVVIVTINYRLGVFGLLNLDKVTEGRIPATGNEGLLDQVAALEWVRDNIAAFGGDPGNVTVFGQSAGGASVGHLMVMPSARGLFHKGILQSGNAARAVMLDEAVKTAETYLSLLGVKGNDVKALRALTVDQLLTAHSQLLAKMPLPNGEPSVTKTTPVVDGKVVPEPPMKSIKSGAAMNIPIIVGCMLDEWKVFTMTQPVIPQLPEAAVVGYCQQTFFLPPEMAQNLVETYKRARQKRGDDTSPLDLFNAINGDFMFRTSATWVAEEHSRHNPHVHCYLCTWKSPIMGGILGACHSLDVDLLFGTHGANFVGSGPEADKLSHNMQDSWAAFARTGDPSCDTTGKWPPYGDKRITMILDKKCHLEEAPSNEELRAWDFMR